MFYCFRQGKHMFLQQYHDLFQGQVVVLDEVGVTIPDEILVESVWLWQMIEQVLPAKEADHIAAREQAPRNLFHLRNKRQV